MNPIPRNPKESIALEVITHLNYKIAQVEKHQGSIDKLTSTLLLAISNSTGRYKIEPKLIHAICERLVKRSSNRLTLHNLILGHIENSQPMQSMLNELGNNPNLVFLPRMVRPPHFANMMVQAYLRNKNMTGLLRLTAVYVSTTRLHETLALNIDMADYQENLDKFAIMVINLSTHLMIGDIEEMVTFIRFKFPTILKKNKLDVVFTLCQRFYDPEKNQILDALLNICDEEDWRLKANIIEFQSHQFQAKPALLCEKSLVNLELPS
jgi:hypothetical protein